METQLHIVKSQINFLDLYSFCVLGVEEAVKRP